MIVLVQNDDKVPPGMLVNVLRDAGMSFKVLQPFAGDRLDGLSELAAVIVLGGSMSVHETQAFPFLIRAKAFIRDILEREIPYLGICLGGQLLAEATGGKVRCQTNVELGCHTVCLAKDVALDPLFQGLPKHFVTFQWHNDSFEPPEGACHLASSVHCRYQAFRWGKSAYGIQFHPEVNQQIVSMWSGMINRQE